MDGKGAWRDNVFVERLWRSMKYEEVYLRAYDSVPRPAHRLAAISTSTMGADLTRGMYGLKAITSTVAPQAGTARHRNSSRLPKDFRKELHSRILLGSSQQAKKRGVSAMSQSAFETSEQVLKFDPKAKGRSDVTPLDDAGQAIVAQIRTAADLANQDCDRAMSLAHKLSMELRAAEDRTHQLLAEVELWRNRATRAEEWLRTIQKEIEDKLIVRRPLSGIEETILHR
jgi:hypothetical protein